MHEFASSPPRPTAFTRPEAYLRCIYSESDAFPANPKTMDLMDDARGDGPPRESTAVAGDADDSEWEYEYSTTETEVGA